MQKTSLIVILFVFFVGCNTPIKKQEKTSSSIASKEIFIDTLQSNIQRIDLEIEETIVCFDTLKIVSSNHDLLYNPFGIYTNIEEFLGSLPKEVFVEKQINENGVEMYLIQFNNSHIKVSVCETWYNSYIMVNVASAEIKDDAIKVADCIKTGMTKQLFIEMLHLEHTSNFNEIKVVELISALDGSWHYYIFDKNDILSKIEIK